MKRITIFCVLAISFSCKKQSFSETATADQNTTTSSVKSGEPAIDTAKVYGNWSLINSIGGLAGRTFIPADKYLLGFDHNGLTTRYYNGSFSADKFAIVKRISFINKQLSFQIQFIKQIIIWKF